MQVRCVRSFAKLGYERAMIRVVVVALNAAEKARRSLVMRTRICRTNNGASANCEG